MGHGGKTAHDKVGLAGLAGRAARLTAACGLALTLSAGLVPVTAIAEEGAADAPATEVEDGSALTAADAWVRWGRLAGHTALDTMAAISADWGAADTVILATQDGYWDTLVGAGVAGLAGAPVLMTSPKGLSSQTASELARLAPTRVVALGGPLSLPEAVLDEATRAAGGAEKKRLEGTDAAGTAVAALKDDPAATGVRGVAWSSTALVATDTGYWDALAASPVAWAQHMPIVLTRGVHEIPAETIGALLDTGIDEAVICGGELSVGPEVASALQAAGIRVRRIGGQDAVETSELIATWAIDELGMSADGLCVATTEGYWDALAGSALCGRRGSCMLLTNDGRWASTASFVRSRCRGVTRVDILGGELSVTPRVATALEFALNGDAVHDLYAGVLADASALRGVFSELANSNIKETSYSLYDVGADGVTELFVIGYDGEARLPHVYTVRDGALVYLGRYDWYNFGQNGDGRLYADLNWTPGTAEPMIRMEIEGDALVSREVIVEGFVGGGSAYNENARRIREEIEERWSSMGLQSLHNYKYAFGSTWESASTSDHSLLNRVLG